MTQDIYYLQDGRPVKVLQRYEDQPQWLVQLIPGDKKQWVFKADLRQFPLPLSVPAELSQINAGIRDFLSEIGTDPLTAQHDAAQLFEKFERLILSLEAYSSPDWGDISGLISDNADLKAALDLKADDTDLQYFIPNVARGVAGGVATLDANAKVPLNQLPAEVGGVDILPAADIFLEAESVAFFNVALSGLLGMNGVQLVNGTRVLLTGQTIANQNGLWVAASGAWTRPDDFNETADLVRGMAISILGGTEAGSIYLLSTSNPVFGGSLAFQRQPGIGGPVSATPGAFARWNGTSGKLLANARTIEDNAGQVQIFRTSLGAPFLLNANSTGLVVNLNADLLDGQHGSYYLDRANHTGTIAFSSIGSRPTTLSGYGITDAAAAGHSHATFTTTVSGFVPAPTSSSGRFLKDDGTWATVSGSVSSVGLSLPNIFTVSGSPVTTSGTLTGTLATQTANQVWAGPVSGGATAPTFRALVATDIPDLAAAKITSGTFAIAQLPVASSGTSNTTQVVRADDARLSNARTPTAHASTHNVGGTDPLTGLIDANARLAVLKGGVAVGTRRKLNFVEGSNISLTVTEDTANEEVDITITSTASGGGGGTVTSVGLGLPTSVFSISNSPVIASGTLTGSFISQTANQVFAAPAGTNGVPAFRTLVDGDIPALSASKITSGLLPVTRGGTGLGTIAANKFLYTSAIDTLTTGDITTFGLSLLDDTTAAAARTTLGLGTAATSNSGDFAAATHSHSNFTLSVAGFVPAPATTSGRFLRDDGTWAAGNAGTVTSVGLALPGIFTVTGSPVATSGTLTGTLNNQAANLVWAGPTAGSATQPLFRSLVSADLPTAIDSNARVAVSKAGVAVGTRRKINFIEGSNVSLTITDDVVNEEVDVTITSTAAGGGGGTVTSVALDLPTSVFSVTGSPIVASGTLTGAFASQSANQVFAAPNGSSGTPGFRALAAADIPNLDGSKITSGTITMLPTGTAAGQAGTIAFQELAANGTDKVLLKAPDVLGAERIVTLPNASGTIALTNTSVQTSRIVTSSGAGITGGGALSSDRTFSLSTLLQNFAGLTLGANNLIVSTGVDTFAAVATNITTTKQFLSQTGTGAAATAPSWGALAQADLPVMTGATTTVAGVRGAVPAPTAGHANRFLASDGTFKEVEDYILIVDEKASGTHGGTFTAGAWQTRVLTAEKTDTGNHAILASNQITLAAGTYQCAISAPAYYAGNHKIRLRNITDSTTTLIGTSEVTQNQGDGIQNRSFIVGLFTIAASKTFQVQHRCSTSVITNTGLGVATNYDEVELYTIVEFWKVS